LRRLFVKVNPGHARKNLSPTSRWMAGKMLCQRVYKADCHIVSVDGKPLLAAFLPSRTGNAFGQRQVRIEKGRTEIAGWRELRSRVHSAA
jgi:hypothetical protein